MKDFLDLTIEEKDIENYNREFRTKLKLRTRIMDLLYKVKEDSSYILLEHQSTIDYKMAKRMGDYCSLVIENDEEYKNKRKNAKAPIIYPVVLSTSKRPWDAPTTIVQNENNKYKFPPLTYPKYMYISVVLLFTFRANLKLPFPPFDTTKGEGLVECAIPINRINCIPAL